MKPLALKPSSLCIVVLTASFTIARPADSPIESGFSSGEGLVSELVPGYAYIRGKEGKIVVVQTSSGPSYVFVPKAEVQVDERVIFSGAVTTVASWVVIDSSEGSLYRPAGKTAQEQIQELTRVQEEQERQQPASTIIDDDALRALPTSIVETKEQKAERRARAAEEERNRKLSLLLSVIGLLIGVLAIERLPGAMRSLFVALQKATSAIRVVNGRFRNAFAKRRLSSRGGRKTSGTSKSTAT